MIAEQNVYLIFPLYDIEFIHVKNGVASMRVLPFDYHNEMNTATWLVESNPKETSGEDANHSRVADRLYKKASS